MKVSRKALFGMILLVICIAIHIYSLDPERVEAGYSNLFFIGFSDFLRSLSGIVSFSIGDILYGLAFAWIVWKIFTWIFFKKNNALSFRQTLQKKSWKILILLAGIYIVFNIFWGINYNRKGIAAQLGMKMDTYNTEELREMNCLLLDKINASRQVMVEKKITYPSNKDLFKMVTQAYDLIHKQYPFLIYNHPSVKPAMWGWLGNYAGFTGYYNPFTAEAQVNTTVPKFIQPFVACHEVAHQVGYAKEMEANFVGYLAASASPEPLVQYSVYLDLFIYANRNLYHIDSAAARIYFHDLAPAVLKDLEEWKKFSRRHANPAEPVVRWIYGKFLQGNEQPEGILAYDQVTAFIIAYYKKFGKI